jgi:hypothetical protein
VSNFIPLFSTAFSRLESNLFLIDLLIIGLIGSVHNLHAAGFVRSAGAQGLHLIHEETIRDVRVATVLRQVEERYPLVVPSLIDVFFPGGLRVKTDEEHIFWRNALRMRTGPSQHGTRVDMVEYEEGLSIGVSAQPLQVTIETEEHKQVSGD